MCEPCQPCASASVSSAEVNAYSDELIAIIESQGSQTIQTLDRPRMSRSVSPIRYTLPFSSTTSRNTGVAVPLMLPEPPGSAAIQPLLQRSAPWRATELGRLAIEPAD